MMRIVVPVKQVPETAAARMDEETGTVVRDGVALIVNPLDLYAVELALQLREAHGGEVVTVSMGPAAAAAALRETVAMGADAAVLVSGRAFAGSDTWATARALAAALRRLGDVDLVICGERATDGDTGQVGPGLAAALDLPVATYVAGVEAVWDGGCRVRCLVEDGSVILDMDLPGVLTVVKEAAEPRLPTLRGKQRARALDIPVWDAASLGLDAAELGSAGSPTRVVKIMRPQVTRTCQRFSVGNGDELAAATAALVTLLRERRLLRGEPQS